jgi:glycogen debranching enzyme
MNRATEHSILDIYMLMGREKVGGESVLYPYAGVPWFSAPFGRDGVITAYQMLPWFPKIAQGVLDYCFGTLGTKFDAFTDEQPGKVFHEIRRGEMSTTREVPFVPYYGSVDSTPLCLILLHEYIRWTKDFDRLRKWWPDALRALEWVQKWGDPDEDGFIEYSMQSPSGLVNQGWKDSTDSIMHADGKFVRFRDIRFARKWECQNLRNLWEMKIFQPVFD